MDTRWSPTPGRTLVTKFLRSQEPVKYRAKAKGLNPRTGEPQYIDYTLQGVIESMSNEFFTTVKTQPYGQPVVTLRIDHSTRYLTEA